MEIPKLEVIKLSNFFIAAFVFRMQTLPAHCSFFNLFVPGDQGRHESSSPTMNVATSVCVYTQARRQKNAARDSEPRP